MHLAAVQSRGLIASWLATLTVLTASVSRADDKTPHPVFEKEIVAPAVKEVALDQDVVQGKLGNKLHEHMTGLAKDGFSGALLVAKGNTVVIAKGYGLANREQQIPFTSATAFDIGSITKQFTGAAIAKLQMQGKLSEDDKLSK